MGPTTAPSRLLTMVAAATAVILIAPPVSAAGVLNGGFELGTFNDWDVAASPDGSWSIFQAGDDAPLSGRDIPDPPKGLYAAVSDSDDAASVKVLYQEIALSRRPQKLIFVVAYENGHATFCAPDNLDIGIDPMTAPCNQQFRVDIMRPGSDPMSTDDEDVLRRVYVTTPGKANQRSKFRVASKLTRFRGETVLLRFAQVDNRAHLNVVVDNVRLKRI